MIWRSAFALSEWSGEAGSAALTFP